MLRHRARRRVHPGRCAVSAWGRTGRVTLNGPPGFATNRRGQVSDVLVDGAEVGWVGAPNDVFEWWAVPTYPSRCNLDLPTLDHAVMWVLRRARPDVWRAERGPVARVERCQFAHGAWHVYTSGGLRQGRCFASQTKAMTAAASAVTR